MRCIMIMTMMLMLLPCVTAASYEVSPADGADDISIDTGLRINFTAMDTTSDRSVMYWRTGVPYTHEEIPYIHRYTHVSGYQYHMAHDDEHIMTVDGQTGSDKIHVYSRQNLSYIRSMDDHGHNAYDIQADGRWIYIATANYGLRVYDADTLTYNRTIQYEAYGVAYNDEYVYTGAHDGNLRRYHRDNLSLAQTVDLGDRIYDVAVHDGTVYATGTNDAICSYDADDLGSIACDSIGGNGDKISAKNGVLLVIAGYGQNTIYRYDGPQLNRLHEYAEVNAPGAIYGDARYTYAGDNTDKLYIYDTSNHTLMRTLNISASSTEAVSVIDGYLHMTSNSGTHDIYSMRGLKTSSPSVPSGSETDTGSLPLRPDTTYSWSSTASSAGDLHAYGPFTFTTVPPELSTGSAYDSSMPTGTTNLTVSSTVPLVSCSWSGEDDTGDMHISSDNLTAWYEVDLNDPGQYDYDIRCTTVFNGTLNTTTTVEIGYSATGCPDDPERVFILAVFFVLTVALLVISVITSAPIFAIFAGFCGIFTGVYIAPCTTLIGPVMLGGSVVMIVWGATAGHDTHG